MQKVTRKFLFLVFALSICVSSIEAAKAVSTAENTWTTLSSMPHSDLGLKAATVDNKIYIMGGSINYEYNPAEDSWTAKAPMPTPRNWFSIAAYQNKIYTFGGRHEGACNSIEVYDTATDTWTTLAPMPINVTDIDANVVDGKIYIIGLPNRQSSFSVNLVYDIATNIWVNSTTMPYPVNAYASAVVNGKIYIFGGYGSIRNQTQIYDPRTDSWTLGSPIPLPALGAGVAATTGIMAPKSIYIIGGMENIDGLNTTQVYNPKNDSWAVGSPMPTARTGLTVAIINDLLYAFAGVRYAVFSPALTVTEQYAPYGYGCPDSSSNNATPNESHNTDSLSDSTVPAPDFPLIVVILLIVFVIIGGFLFVYLKQKNISNHSYARIAG